MTAPVMLDRQTLGALRSRLQSLSRYSAVTISDPTVSAGFLEEVRQCMDHITGLLPILDGAIEAFPSTPADPSLPPKPASPLILDHNVSWGCNRVPRLHKAHAVTKELSIDTGSASAEKSPLSSPQGSCGSIDRPSSRDRGSPLLLPSSSSSCLSSLMLHRMCQSSVVGYRATGPGPKSPLRSNSADDDLYSAPHLRLSVLPSLSPKNARPLGKRPSFTSALRDAVGAHSTILPAPGEPRGPHTSLRAL